MAVVLSVICVKWKFLYHSAYLGKIWLSTYRQKLFSANEISIFFNCQFFINRWISDFDFWHVDKLEWKEQGLLTGFMKKFSFRQMGYFEPKTDVSS